MPWNYASDSAWEVGEDECLAKWKIQTKIQGNGIMPLHSDINAVRSS